MKSKIDLYVINEVKKKRVAKGFSQLMLANELGVSVGFIGSVESERYPTHYNIQHLNKLAIILDCSVGDFFPVKPLK